MLITKPKKKKKRGRKKGKGGGLVMTRCTRCRLQLWPAAERVGASVSGGPNRSS